MLLVQLSLLCINSRNLINMEINQSGMQIHAKEFNFASCSTNPFQVPNVFYTLNTPPQPTSQPPLLRTASSRVYFPSFVPHFLKKWRRTYFWRQNFSRWPQFYLSRLSSSDFFRSLNLLLLSSYLLHLITKVPLRGAEKATYIPEDLNFAIIVLVMSHHAYFKEKVRVSYSYH
jgi:hypothetical protein